MSWNPVTAVATAALATLAAVLACVLLASPAVAQCGGKPIPPGNSEVDQYQEAIPGNCGETEPNKDGNGGGSVPSGTSEDLEALGEDGAAVADLVTSTGTGAGDGSGSGNGKDGGQAPGAGAAAAQADTGSAVSAAVRGLAGDSDDGLGAALPVLLAALLAAALAAVAIRRSRA